ncbi:MAG: hypothetical protein RQ760_18125, partial [Sedimentisphaerales bacterium]|nr:hypothetical protein [Sedimentisphaerales bacterium]
MNSADNIERAVEQLHITTRPETDKRILDDAFVALEKSKQDQSVHIGRSAGPKTLRIRIIELAAVAAVIFVIFALFLNTSTKDIELDEIYQVLGSVDNICITTFEPASNEPMQIEWVSQALNIDMFRIGRQFVLWDIPNKVKMTKNLSSGSVNSQTLFGEMLSRVKQVVLQRFGLVPFSNISDISGARWTRLEDSEARADVSGTKVYDLTWQDNNAASGEIMLYRRRFFVDKRNNLPKRIELYGKLQSEAEYNFETFSVVTYPSEDQIRTLI